MYYGDKQSAVALLGHTLADRGWTLHGYHPDQSDIQSDYFHPAAWDGVATHPDAPGVVVCIDVNGYVTRYSGGQDATRMVPDAPCPRCHGAKADPEGWTYDDARANPRAYHDAADARRGTGRAMLRDVVSPLPFLGCGPYGAPADLPDDLYGRERCDACGGNGHTFKPESYRIEWPTFQANPPRRNWHVEKDGVIRASGTGVYQCRQEWITDPATGRNERVPDATTRALVTKIERAAGIGTGRVLPDADGGSGDLDDLAAQFATEGVTVRPSTQRDGYSEVVFPAKPADDVRAALKAAGYRWALRAACWYGPTDRLPALFA